MMHWQAKQDDPKLQTPLHQSSEFQDALAAYVIHIDTHLMCICVLTAHSMFAVQYSDGTLL